MNTDLHCPGTMRVQAAVLPPGYEKGDVLFYMRFSGKFYNGNKVSYGHEGKLLGPVENCSRPHVRMLFKGHEGGTDVLLEDLSFNSPVSPTHAHLLCRLYLPLLHTRATRLLCPLGERL